MKPVATAPGTVPRAGPGKARRRFKKIVHPNRLFGVGNRAGDTQPRVQCTTIELSFYDHSGKGGAVGKGGSPLPREFKSAAGVNRPS